MADPVRPPLMLDPVAAAVASARRYVRTALAECGASELEASAELGVSELVTNAILHAALPLTISIEVTAAAVTVSVRDGHPRLPVARVSSSTATTGRGLAIVATLADEHGIDVRPPGKAVWFRLLRGR
jgi:anti-sigma regulatory factor (Ser/Thr protein kinase)